MAKKHRGLAKKHIRKEKKRKGYKLFYKRTESTGGYEQQNEKKKHMNYLRNGEFDDVHTNNKDGRERKDKKKHFGLVGRNLS